MRTRLFLVVALGSSSAVVYATGALASLRDQVQTLLSDPAIATIAPEIGEAKARAKVSLAQAEATRSSGKEDAAAIAGVFDETAFEWAQLAKELVELAALQTDADKAEQRQIELDAQLKREKAHLEETEARRGRALAALKNLGETADGQSPLVAPKPKGAAQ